MTDGPSEVKKCRDDDVFIKVKSKDGTERTLTQKAAKLSGTISPFVENFEDDVAISKMEPIPLPNLSSESLDYIVRWCEQHRDCPAWEEEKWWQNERAADLTKWENEFMAEMTPEILYNVYLAANYLDIKCLLGKCAQTVSEMIKGKSVEEIREIWSFENASTPEEEEEIHSQIFTGGRFKMTDEPSLIKVKSKEGNEHTLTQKAAKLSGTINQFVENLENDEAISKMEPIPLLEASSESLDYIIRWCEQHRDCPAWDEERWWQNERDADLTKWENEFMAEMTSEILYDVFMAANYLGIKCLLDKCAQTVADKLKGKSVEEVRELWILENDFTPEEEEEIKNNENPWEAILRHQEQLDKEKEGQDAQ